MVKMVGDVVGLLPALGASRACLVGHDWGAPIVWNSALLRPDLFWGVAGLSVPFGPRGDAARSRRCGDSRGDEEFYVEYFQEPGRAEARDRAGRAAVAARLLLERVGRRAAAGAEHRPWSPARRQMRDRFSYPADAAGVAHRRRPRLLRRRVRAHRLTGGLNRYRNVERDWEDFAAFAGAPIQVPALFIGGDRDGSDDLGQAVDRAVPADAAQAVALGDPAGLRPLDPAGAARGDQSPPRRFLVEPAEVGRGR